MLSAGGTVRLFSIGERINLTDPEEGGLADKQRMMLKSVEFVRCRALSHK